MSTIACEKCGSKRITEIAANADRPASIWCHTCGAVLTKETEPTPAKTTAADRLLAAALNG